MQKNIKGSLVVVGVGMTLGAHISPLSLSYIKNADIVFTGVSNYLVEMWIKELNPSTTSLQYLYEEGKDRRQTYREMVNIILAQVRQGKTVVGAFYGHPGIFAWAPHQAVRQALQEGFSAHMEPGISAEDCLYADLHIDPGACGAQHYETSQFMFNDIAINHTAYLILWQIGLAGDQTGSVFYTDNPYRRVLINKLKKIYPSNHSLVLYECPTLPVDKVRIEKVSLDDLDRVAVSQHTTLVIPPWGKVNKDEVTLEALRILTAQLNQTISPD